MQSCLKSCGDCGEREEAAGLEPDGDEEVARALRRPTRHARRPDVDEAEPSIVRRIEEITVCDSRMLRCMRRVRRSSQR